jgi:head-tail adaptor
MSIDLLNRKCVILQPVITKNSLGGIVHNWSIYQDNVPMRVRYLKGYEIVQSGLIMTIPTHRIYLPPALDIDEHFAIIDKTNGNSYDIILQNQFYSTHGQYDCRMVSPITNYAAPTTQTWNVVYNGVQITYNTSPVVYTQVL